MKLEIKFKPETTLIQVEELYREILVKNHHVIMIEDIALVLDELNRFFDLESAP